MTSPEEEGLKHLRKIERELGEIRDRTPTTAHAFLYGILQGSGAVVGGIAMVVLLGWLLTILGVIPGFSEIAQYIDAAMKARLR